MQIIFIGKLKNIFYCRNIDARNVVIFFASYINIDNYINTVRIKVERSYT